MSRIYFTVAMQHKEIGLSLPTLSFETADQTGGGFEFGGIHPSALAAMAGKGPKIGAIGNDERFDIKFNINGKRTSLSLVANTTKHLPHVEWSSKGGLGKLPMVGLGALASQFFKGGSSKQGDKSTQGASRSTRQPNTRGSSKRPREAASAHRSPEHRRIEGAPSAPKPRSPRSSGHRGSGKSTPRHTPRSSRESSSNISNRSRAKDYDSGYGSDEHRAKSRRGRGTRERGGRRR